MRSMRGTYLINYILIPPDTNGASKVRYIYIMLSIIMGITVLYYYWTATYYIIIIHIICRCRSGVICKTCVWFICFFIFKRTNTIGIHYPYRHLETRVEPNRMRSRDTCIQIFCYPAKRVPTYWGASSRRRAVLYCCSII